MARKTAPLTNTQVKQAKPSEKQRKLSDGEGLQLWVKPNGSKLWMLDYTHPVTGKRSSIAFGPYPALSLAEARKKRSEAKELIVSGLDPKEHKDDLLRQSQLAASHTLKSVATDWFAIKQSKIAETTSRSLWRNFENHVFPKLGHRPIDKLLAPEVISVLKPLAAKGSLETTSKVIGHINEVMRYAVNTGLLHHNSLAGIRSAFDTPKVTHMPTLKPEELPELMKAINYASIKLVTRCLIEWQLHTMVRPREAAEAKWSEIDFENGWWVIPAERMKMKVEHTVPLTPQVLAILEIVKPVSGHREYIFPSDRQPTKPSNPETANKALQRMGFKGRLVAHGMRAIASTTLNEQGFDGDIIESALAHQEQNEVRRAYNRTQYLERRKSLMCWWSEHIENAMTGKSPKATNVKHLRIG
ncbi:integrase domain-containing protein [uncultured Paraglaciecola sp.]|uniref:integrase domain-containing protein n=1 Tax=uncultured Paraglaciecola sp. TaxID=1765024 RepID=UPI002627CA2F|nr:integrase domain-containing protein [uncultured Paraglaciecola sp.]